MIMEETEKIEVQCCHHEHPLTPINHDKPYRCAGCKTVSPGLRYRCEQCNFELHEECTFTSHETASYHDFFPGRAFGFFPKPPRSRGCKEKEAEETCSKCLRRCDACGKAVDGFVYHSKGKGRDLDLHPRCFDLKRSILGGDDVEFLLRDTLDKKCMWCKKTELPETSKIRGWSYVSGCGEYHFHVNCVTEMVLATWSKDSGGEDEVSKCLADLAKLDVLANRRDKKLRGGCKKFVRVVRVFVKTFALLLFGFGEPTISLTLLLTQLILA